MLKGVGAMMSLPVLEAMRPLRALAAADGAPSSQSPVRLAVLYMPNGVNPHAWTPEGTGRDFKLSPTLTPLADFKDDLLVLTQLWNAAANTGDGHYVKTGGFLTGTTITRTTAVYSSIGCSSMQAKEISRHPRASTRRSSRSFRRSPSQMRFTSSDCRRQHNIKASSSPSATTM